MVTPSQLLTTIGLFLEFLSVLLIAYNSFYPLDKKERKIKYLEGKGKPIDDKLESDKRIGLLTITFLAVGMFFQGIAIFL